MNTLQKIENRGIRLIARGIDLGHALNRALNRALVESLALGRALDHALDPATGNAEIRPIRKTGNAEIRPIRKTGRSGSTTTGNGAAKDRNAADFSTGRKATNTEKPTKTETIRKSGRKKSIPSLRN